MLTFGELETAASFGLTGFLTFDNARVAGDEACAAESLLVVGVDFDESAGNREAESFGLTFVAAAVEVDADVVFFCGLEEGERLFNDELKN